MSDVVTLHGGPRHGETIMVDGTSLEVVRFMRQPVHSTDDRVRYEIGRYTPIVDNPRVWQFRGWFEAGTPTEAER